MTVPAWGAASQNNMVADATPCVGKARSNSQKNIFLNRRRMDGKIIVSSTELFYVDVSGHATPEE